MTPRHAIDGHAVPMLDRSMSASRGWEVVVIGMDGRGDGDGDGGLEVGGGDVQGIYIWAAVRHSDEGKVTLTVCPDRDPVPIAHRAIPITNTELPNRCSAATTTITISSQTSLLPSTHPSFHPY